MKLKHIALCIAGGAVALYAAAQNNIAEEVAWVIGDDPIYKS